MLKHSQTINQTMRQGWGSHGSLMLTSRAGGWLVGGKYQSTSFKKMREGGLCEGPTGRPVAEVGNGLHLLVIYRNN